MILWRKRSTLVQEISFSHSTPWFIFAFSLFVFVLLLFAYLFNRKPSLHRLPHPLFFSPSTFPQEATFFPFSFLVQDQISPFIYHPLSLLIDPAMKLRIPSGCSKNDKDTIVDKVKGLIFGKPKQPLPPKIFDFETPHAYTQNSLSTFVRCDHWW